MTYNVEPVGPSALETIARWHAARGLPEGWPRLWLSDLGWWVPGLAAGWLITTNSSRALIEDFATNPRAPKSETYAAMQALESHIVACAKDLGFLYLVGTTKIESIRAKAEKHGYHVTEREFSYLFKDLRA